MFPLRRVASDMGSFASLMRAGLLVQTSDANDRSFVVFFVLLFPGASRTSLFW